MIVEEHDAPADSEPVQIDAVLLRSPLNARAYSREELDVPRDKARYPHEQHNQDRDQRPRDGSVLALFAGFVATGVEVTVRAEAAQWAFGVLLARSVAGLRAPLAVRVVQVVEAAVVNLAGRVREAVPPLVHVEATKEATRWTGRAVDALGTFFALRGQRIPEK